MSRVPRSGPQLLDSLVGVAVHVFNAIVNRKVETEGAMRLADSWLEGVI